MDFIHNNPFRILGLFAEASEGDVQRNMAYVNALINTKKAISFDQDFPFLDQIDRSAEAVDAAVKALDIDSERLIHALFWFVKGGHVDETAFSSLKSGNIEKAEEIWCKVIASEELYCHNHTSLNNLGTLKLAQAHKAENLDLDILKSAVELKMRLISSDAYEDFASKVVKNHAKSEPEEISIVFVGRVIKSLRPHLQKDFTKIAAVFDIFVHYPVTVREHIRELLSEEPKRFLSNLLNNAKDSRKKKPQFGNVYANRLSEQSRQAIAALKDLYGKQDVQFQTLADKVTKEILQCAIDFFNAHEDDTEFDPSLEALQIIENLQQHAYSSLVKQRIDQNIDNLTEWHVDKPDRDRYGTIKEPLDALYQLLKDLQTMKASVSVASAIANKCKPYLIIIRDKLGRNDSFYLKISSAIVNNALNMAIDSYNSSKTVNLVTHSDPMLELDMIRLINSLDLFDVDRTTKERLQKNNAVIFRNTRTHSMAGLQNYVYTPSLKERIQSALMYVLWIIVWIGGIVLIGTIVDKCSR